MVIKLEYTDDKIINYGGILLVKQLLDKTELGNRLDEIDTHSNSTLKSEVILRAISFLCMGKTHFDYINEFTADETYKTMMNLKEDVSEAAYRQNLDKIGRSIEKIILEENIEMIKNSKAPLSYTHKDYYVLDFDVTPMDNSRSHKEGLGWTYKQFVGYAPMMAYLAEEGYLVNSELRIGNQHCQEGTPEFIRKTIVLVRKLTDGKILARFDSGNDSIENIVVMITAENPIDYLIKRNLRRESKEKWLAEAKEFHTSTKKTPTKDEYFGSKIVSRETIINGEKVSLDLRLVYHIKEIKAKKGQMLIVPEIEVDTYWTSLDDPGEVIVKLYNNHGTSEQFHSEIKSDMNVERLPSGKFDTNYLMLQLSMMSYNILRIIGLKTLEKNDCPLRNTNVERRRVRTVMLNLMYFAAKLVKGGGKVKLKLSIHNAWSKTYMRVFNSFLSA